MVDDVGNMYVTKVDSVIFTAKKIKEIRKNEEILSEEI